MSTSGTTPDPTSGTTSEAQLEALTAFVTSARWFGGKGRAATVTGVRRLTGLPDAEGGPRVQVNLVQVGYDDGGSELYQVPLSCYVQPEHRLDHAFVGWWEDPELGWVHAYDALHDREAMAAWLRGFVEGAAGPVGSPAGLTFHRLPGHDLDPEASSSLFSGEQSNSSVFFGEDAILKVFRKVTPGVNPDIEIHRLLTEAGSSHVAGLYGWVEVSASSTAAASSTTEGETLHLAMLQQFLRTATDGWDLALASVRNLFADPDLHASEVGGDFAAESSRLGDALREIHETLRQVAPTDDAAVTPGDVATAMRTRLDESLTVVPELAQHADGLRRLYAEVADLPDLEVQRIHGDLHLGQTLRTALGWKVVDFEGEPAKPLAERSLPDSRWRDVAGMIRSFDYAPHVVERSLGEEGPDLAAQLAVRAEEWAHRNQNHFLVAYAGGELTAQQRTLVDAYVADKAVYECVYETRNRPAWVAIPLAAVAAIGARA